jgi:hypothetical protein
MAYIKKADRIKMAQESQIIPEQVKPSPELLNKVKLKLEYQPVDAFHVSKEVKDKYQDNVYHLLWARNDAKRTRELEQIGYDYCTVDPDKRSRLDKKDDGYIRNGDSILMYCSIELYHSRNKYFADKSKALRPKTNQKNIDLRNQISGLHPTITNRQEFSQSRGADVD